MISRFRNPDRRAAARAGDHTNPVAPPGPADLFAPPAEGDSDAADPAALARAATLASGRAMKARQWSEARALAGLAWSFARLADRVGPPGVDDWGAMGPDEAAFEAVRRKVLGLGSNAATGSRSVPETLGKVPDGPDR